MVRSVNQDSNCVTPDKCVTKNNPTGDKNGRIFSFYLSFNQKFCVFPKTFTEIQISILRLEVSTCFKYETPSCHCDLLVPMSTKATAILVSFLKRNLLICVVGSVVVLQQFKYIPH